MIELNIDLNKILKSRIESQIENLDIDYLVERVISDYVEQHVKYRLKDALDRCLFSITKEIIYKKIENLDKLILDKFESLLEDREIVEEALYGDLKGKLWVLFNREIKDLPEDIKKKIIDEK